MPSHERSAQATIDELLELEEELTSPESGAAGTYDRGTIADAAKVPAEHVPEEYPVPIDTEQALRLGIDAGRERVPVYLEWPGADEQSDHLDRLLDALGREPDEFANVYGDTVALAVSEGWHGIDAERTAAIHGGEAASQDPSLRRTELGLAGSVVAALLALPLAGSGLPGLAGLGSLLLVGSWIAIPTLLYVDKKRVGEHLGWEPEAGWLVAAIFPVANVLAGSGYLVERRARLEGVEGVRPSETWKKAVVAGIALPFVSLPVMVASSTLGGMLFTLSVGALPLALYFDAKYVESATGEDQNGGAFAIGALVASFVLVGWLVGVVYLLRRPDGWN